jgi:hypothetical protein
MTVGDPTPAGHGGFHGRLNVSQGFGVKARAFSFQALQSAPQIFAGTDRHWPRVLNQSLRFTGFLQSGSDGPEIG